jgi:hypothetical protein
MVAAAPTGSTAAEPVAVEPDELELEELELDPMFGQLCVVDDGLVDELELGLDAGLEANLVAAGRFDVADELLVSLLELDAVDAFAAGCATWWVWAPAMALPRPTVPPTRARPVTRAAVRLSFMGFLLLSAGTTSIRQGPV